MHVLSAASISIANSTSSSSPPSDSVSLAFPRCLLSVHLPSLPSTKHTASRSGAMTSVPITAHSASASSHFGQRPLLHLQQQPRLWYREISSLNSASPTPLSSFMASAAPILQSRSQRYPNPSVTSAPERCLSRRSVVQPSSTLRRGKTPKI